MRGSETFHAGKRRGLSWGLVMARKQSEEFFHALGRLFSDYWGFPGAAWCLAGIKLFDKRMAFHPIA